jgi:hypothetical protein
VADAVKKPIGRNDPCPCGSGKKYKQCCLAKDEAAERARRAKQTESAPPVEAEATRSAPPPKHQTAQPWKSRTNTRGFQKLNIPRRSGGS